MNNKYKRQNEMVTSCEQMLYFYDENKRICNRFTTYKKHLRNKITFVALISLVFSVLQNQSQTYVEGKQIVLNGFTSEMNSESLTTHAENMKSSKKITKVLTRNLVETPNSDYFENEPNNGIQRNAGNIYNELTISNENNTEIKDSSDFTTSDTYSHFKNLELSIQNSVKSKTIKKLPESEIRKALSTDLISSDNIEKSTMEIMYSKEDIFQSSQPMKKENGSSYQFEDQVLKNNFSLFKKNLSDSMRDSFNDNYQGQITQNNNSTLRLFTNMPSLGVDFSFKANETSKLELEMINTVVANHKNIRKVAPSKEFVMQNTVNNYNDDILSVDLHETISILPKISKETIFLRIDENPKYHVPKITEEIENTNDPCTDEQLEHAVIKKVLEKHEVFDDPLITSTYPLLRKNQENDLLITSAEQSSQENKALKSSVDDFYLLGAEQLKDRIQLDDQPTSTYIDDFEEIVSTSENYQSVSEQSLQKHQENELLTTSTEQSNQENKVLKSNIDNIYLLDDDELDAEIIPTSASIEKIEENSFTTEYYQTESEQSYNNYFFNKTIIKELSNNSINEGVPNELYNDKNVSAIDNYNQSIDVSKIIESNSNLFTNIQNEPKIGTIKIEASHIENHKHHSNENFSDIAKKSENIINDLERNIVNISAIWIPDVRTHAEATEQYENNNILKNIQNKNIETTELSNSLKDSLQVTPLPLDDIVATLFEAYPPRDVGQMFNDNLADESAGIGKALPVSVTGPSNRSTVIIIFSSGTALLFIIISVTIFLISFQRQNGTLDIEMQERNCGKDDLEEEDAQTFAKLLEFQLSSSVVTPLGESEECL